MNVFPCRVSYQFSNPPPKQPTSTGMCQRHSVSHPGGSPRVEPTERTTEVATALRVCVCGFIILWKLLNTYDNVKSGSACISPWWAWNHLYIWSLRCFCFALRHTSRDVGYLPPTTSLFISTPWWWGKQDKDETFVVLRIWNTIEINFLTKGNRFLINDLFWMELKTNSTGFPGYVYG